MFKLFTNTRIAALLAISPLLAGQLLTERLPEGARRRPAADFGEKSLS